MTNIVIRIMGGLGNQMFQYAFGRVLKENSNACLKLDITNYEISDNRSFFLGKFEVDFETASRDDIENAVYLSYPVTKYIDRYFPPVAQLLNYYSERTQNSVLKGFVPVRYEFNSSIIDNKSGYFHGYWQSENITDL